MLNCAALIAFFNIDLRIKLRLNDLILQRWVKKVRAAVQTFHDYTNEHKENFFFSKIYFYV